MNTKQDWMRHFANHMVSLEATVMFPGETTPQYFVMTCIVLQVHDLWFLVTAGHTFAFIEEKEQEGFIFHPWRLDDAWGIDKTSKPNIPFPLDDMKKHVLYDDWEHPQNGSGMDYAAILLPEMYYNLLQKNNIAPIVIEEDTPGFEEDYDEYYLFGFPAELLSVKPIDEEKFSVDRGLVVLPLHRLEKPPANLKREIPCFYGVISKGIGDNQEEQIKSIVGMSGGPIFGFKDEFYYLIAMQSSWYQPERQVVGVPMKPFALWINDIIKDAIKDIE